ncbi:zinc ABC transporter substrate-binding protein [bacterium]|nr:zinc ABC transporter substrate-binding protein [bacterium]
MRFCIKIIIAILLLVPVMPGLGNAEQKKVKVITTLFPLFDFVRQVGKEKVDVILLMPPGVEAHSYEPTPRDIVRINQAEVFVYTGAAMEPWAADVVAGIVNKQIVVVNASQGIEQVVRPDESQAGHDKQGRRHRGKSVDPHIWVDFIYAQQMTDAVLAGLVRVDGKNQSFYMKNAEAFKQTLRQLDTRYRETLAQCPRKMIVHGGHFVFGYMTKRYGLEYMTAFRGFSPDSEPTPKQMVTLIKAMKKHQIHYIFIEELIEPKIARIITEETGAEMLLLHGAHNVTKQEMVSGITYVDIMQRNLKNLKKGLGGQ